jgi:hypothetical protein
LPDIVLVVLEVGKDCLVEGNPEIRQMLLAEIRRSWDVEIWMKAVNVTTN